MERIQKNSVSRVEIGAHVAEIARAASSREEFITAVHTAPNKILAIKAVRELLTLHYQHYMTPSDANPQSADQSSVARQNSARLANPLGGRVSDQFRLARAIVELIDRSRGD